ncbi:LamB/YcsF family protein [Chitinophaga oryzae]|uniref:LamB/YcsF family protein n=1 Tax=Chitinophaga oryzae TaxID=2725414 RepID=A0AAE6ZC73_9BACT|nr:5-oxoprolinase subunit PxpA [Chitinophaga oryzae]QJB30143.1 LamB/YcsF family protein [Chitinophaga oryzae]QJB36641.1 LamB/YcsF family protein [Chitinophaga oryzae]
MKHIDLNCDMGEGLDNDAAIMPFISSANIACGYHAGNADTMKKTVSLAANHHVAIGAHPGFADLENFGRSEQQLSDAALYDLVSTQVYALQIICRAHGVPLQHVKPHGALYNMAARTPAMAAVIAKAVKDVDSRLRLFGLSSSALISEAAAAGLKTVSEVFADRTYQDDGSLTPRSQPGAMIENETLAIQQVLQMVTRQEVTARSGKTIPLKAETICIHGDGPHALEYARAIHAALLHHHLTIQHP